MKIKRTLFTCLVALALVCVCLLVLPTKAQAASESDLTFELNADSESYTVRNCDQSASGTLKIPATYNGKPVTAIGFESFSYCHSLTSIIIPDSVTTIGDYAFYSCSSLTSITIPDSVTSIGAAAFAGCANLNYNTFGVCKYLGNDANPYVVLVEATSKYVTSALIMDPTKVIYEGAFNNCTNLAEIVIPDSVTHIGGSAFYGCTNLANITIPNSVIIIDWGAFMDCSSLKSVIIGNSVTTISYGSFYDCTSLTSVTLGNNVITIGDSAFNNCDSLTSITIPDSVTTIGWGAFKDCNNLTSITIPDSIITIGDSAFDNCTNLTYNVYENCKYLGNDANPYVVLVKAISKNITSVTIHNSTRYICDAFDNCTNLTNIAIPDSVINIGDWAFRNCTSLINVTIPHSVTTIGYAAFAHCTNLSSITIPGSVIYIDEFAFSGCKNLINITISDSVMTVGESAFSDCPKLSNVYYTGTQKQWKNISFNPYNAYLYNATIHYKPETPTGFKVSLADYNDVKLSWKAADGANRYYVYYRRAGKLEWKRAGITTSKSYTVKDLVAGGTYEFKVISYYKDNGGTIKGNATKVLTCSTTRNLKAPSKVTVKLYGYDDVQISWSKVTYANGYKVYYKRSTAKTYSYVGFTTGTSIKKANLSDGVKYTFKVVPCTKVNGSYFADDSSKTASVTTLKAVSTPKVAKYTSSKVKVSWTDIAGESGYQVVVTSDKAGKKVITSTATTGKSKVVSAKRGVTYYYKVRAYKTVDGKKIYAPWSAAKAYKLK